jgi:hypothetical protein
VPGEGSCDGRQELAHNPWKGIVAEKATRRADGSSVSAPGCLEFAVDADSTHGTLDEGASNNPIPGSYRGLNRNPRPRTSSRVNAVDRREEFVAVH